MALQTLQKLCWVCKNERDGPQQMRGMRMETGELSPAGAMRFPLRGRCDAGLRQKGESRDLGDGRGREADPSRVAAFVVEPGEGGF